jgi:hypothetical protein
MIKEAKNVDVYTTGRQPSDQDFARISEWIRKDKQKRTRGNNKEATRQKHLTKNGIFKNGIEKRFPIKRYIALRNSIPTLSSIPETKTQQPPSKKVG